mgnify:CR=1 FL=1|tara:strand:+ start:1156 stop:1563 length:408 start_codon:yes stop_codon:yes gene_type:complete
MIEKPHYFLIFCNRYCWQTKFLKNGFKHVILGIYDNGRLVLMERRVSFFMTEIHTVNDKEVISKLFNINGLIRIEMVKSVDFLKNRKIGLYLNTGTCLSIAKMFLNIPNFKVFTPFSLFKYLKKKDKLVNLFTKT